MAAVVCLAFVKSGWASEPTTVEVGEATTRDSGNWFTRTFTSKSKPQQKKLTPEEQQAAKDLADQAHKQAEARKAERERSVEEAALLRRLAVCDQLKLVATRTNDDALLERADKLDEEARAVYSRKIAHLACSHATVVPEDAEIAVDAKPKENTENEMPTPASLARRGR
jgi:hypothetical protein